MNANLKKMYDTTDTAVSHYSSCSIISIHFLYIAASSELYTAKTRFVADCISAVMAGSFITANVLYNIGCDIGQ